MLKKLLNSVIGYKVEKAILYLVAVICVCVIITGVLHIDFSFKGAPDLLSTLSYLLATLLSILILAVLIISNRVSSNFSFIKGGRRRVSRLRKRIIIAFSIGSALPTVIVAVFSTYFFNIGVEAWFDKKISKVLDQSVSVGQSYIEEHILQLKGTAISVAEDLSSMYYDLIHNPELFNRVLNAQAELRSFDEGLVFQRGTNTILAQTALSFSLSFLVLPTHILDKANQGEIVQIKSDPSKIRILIKLKDYNDTYLLLGRLIDAQIIDHIDQTSGAVQEYKALKANIEMSQIKFSVIFIMLSMILLLISIIWGRKFAEMIVKPLRELVIAAEKVKNGDLSVQVPTESLKKDEIKILSSAFNRMVNQIDHQQKDLLTAQRALAWSDVARRVAHEIKNPLTPIQLSSDMLRKKFINQVSDKEAFEKYLNSIYKNAGDIKQIVSEFVDFARLPTPNFAKCEIVSLISDLVESRKLINDSINYSFTSNNREYMVVCDVSQINRVLVNLMLNSEESFPKNSRDKKIAISIVGDADYLKIIVEDNGTGFSQEILKNAKDAYVTTKIHGTGLGLAIVDRIIHDHFGEVYIENNEYGGARVELTMNVRSLKNKLKQE